MNQFKAENPSNVVNKTLRKHCEGIDFPSTKNKYFQITSEGKYWLAGELIPGQTKEQLKSDLKQKKNTETLKQIVKNFSSTSRYVT